MKAWYNGGDYRPAAVIVVWGLGLRLGVWLLFGQHHFVLAAEPTNTDLYLHAVGKHLGEFAIYTHTKPPGAYIRDGFLVALGGGPVVSIGRLFATSVLDSLAAALMLPILIHLRLPHRVGYGACALWSSGLIAWDYWRGGAHWDHPTVFIVALLTWAVCRRLRRRRTCDDLFAGAVGGILVLFYSAAPAVVAPLLVLSSGRSLLSREGLTRCVITLALPVLTLGARVGKNAAQFDLWSTSSTGGQNMMQTVLIAGQNMPKIRAFLQREPDIYNAGNGVDSLACFVDRGDYPDWWRWCFKQAAARHPADGEKRFVAVLYGQCGSVGEGGADLVPLANYLNNAGPERLRDVVQLDKVAIERTPWLLAGPYAGEGSTSRFALEYGKISAQVWWDFQFARPVEAALQLVRAHFIYYVFGAAFFGGDQYEPQFKPRPWLVRGAGWICAPFLLLGGLACYPIALLGWPRPNYLRMAMEVAMLRALAVAACCGALAVNAMGCCENARFFVSLASLVLPVGVWASWQLVSYGMKARQQQED